MDPITIAGIASAGSAALGNTVGAIKNLFGDDGIFGHSSWYKALKVGEAQNKVNQDMALWNMENVTKPVFEMENQEWNRRFSEQNTEWERQFNLQNEYNTPTAQIQRMREAGINPAGGTIDGNQSAGGSVGSPTVNEAASAFAQPANLFDARIAEAQAQLAEANARRADVQNRMTEKEIEAQTINNKTLAQLNQGYVKLQNSELETQETNRKLTRTETKKAKALIRQIDTDSEKILKETKLIEQRINNAREEWYEIRSRTFLNQANENLADKQANRAQLEAQYQSTINKYADSHEQWAIRTMMSKYNLDQAQAKEAFEMGKSIAKGTEIKDWRFRRLKDKWGAVGQWELSIEENRVKAKWEDTPLLTDMDKAQRQWDRDYQTWRASIWYGDELTDRMKRGAFYMGTYQEKPGMGNQTPSTPSYQNVDYYNP